MRRKPVGSPALTAGTMDGLSLSKTNTIRQICFGSTRTSSRPFKDNRRGRERLNPRFRGGEHKSIARRQGRSAQGRTWPAAHYFINVRSRRNLVFEVRSGEGLLSVGLRTSIPSVSFAT